MKIASYTKGDYLVLKIHPHGEELPDLSELEELIVVYLDQGARNIAVNFVNKSCANSYSATHATCRKTT